MILIARTTPEPRNPQIVARLVQGGHQVTIANSTAEAFEAISELQPKLIILEEPQTRRCPNLLCGWIREALNPPPKLLGLAWIHDRQQRAACEACMTLLRPDSDPMLVAATAEALLKEAEPS